MTDKTLASLLASLDGATLVRGDGATTVDTVAHDSRRVAPGALFVAIPGFSTDGHSYLPAALNGGAAAVLVQRGRQEAWEGLPGNAAIIAVDDTRRALSRASAWLYDFPSRKLDVIGITGTDGKTTTGHLVTSVLEAAGARVGRIGTVDVSIAGEVSSNVERMTTPEANEVQRALARMVDAGCQFAIVESTSHGLALHRLADVEYDIAAMTNVTGDHLDFHETFEAYREAKGRLFAALGTSDDPDLAPTAIVNADDPSAGYMLGRAPGARHLSYGLESRDAMLRASNIHLRPDGTSLRIEAGSRRVDTSIQLPAIFNVYNALAAASVGLAVQMDLATVGHGLAACTGVPGRMERIDNGQPFDVIVDFAHTGEAVRKVLDVMHEVTRGQLIIVVGAAGERDPGRRFGVGRAAAERADFAVFTSEDPRSEDPAAIVAEIGRHAENAGRARGRDFIEIEDRREAIAAAFSRAQPGDVVVICGKGHETSMIYGTESRPWDDRSVAREELERLGWNAAQA